MNHFSRLRRAAANAMLGVFHHINPFIACLGLSKHLLDPLLHVIIVGLRSVRRLFAIRPDVAGPFVRLASSFEAKWSYGPASTLCIYLAKIGLWITSDACVTSNDGMLCDLTVTSCRALKVSMVNYWHKIAFPWFVQRKGSPEALVNLNLQIDVFSRLSECEQKLIALNIAGGFQTNALKSKWGENVQVQCN